MKFSRAVSSLLAAVALAVTWPPSSLADTDLDEIRDTQKKILERLDAQDKVLRDILQRVQSAGGGRPQVDPNRVYEIPIADSPVKGPKEASITLVEFSDFQ